MYQGGSTSDEQLVLRAQHGDKQALDELYNRYKSLLDSTARSAAMQARVPPQVTKVKTYTEFAKKVYSYRPGTVKEGNKEATFSTYIRNTLQNVNNFAMSLKSPFRPVGGARIEDSKLYLEAKELLNERLGHDPSDLDIADFLKWPLDKVRNIARTTKPIIESSASDFGLVQTKASFIDPKTQEILDFVYSDLDPDARVVFEYLTGMYSKPLVESTNEIAKRTGMTAQKVSKLKKHIAEKLKEAMQ